MALGAYEPKVLKLALSATEQTGDGAALLQISSDELGTRWLLPVSAEKGSLAGLWVGDVVVNDVSEGRLGTTDVAGGLLTVALRPQEDSGITGAAELQEMITAAPPPSRSRSRWRCPRARSSRRPSAPARGFSCAATSSRTRTRTASGTETRRASREGS